MLKVKRTEVIFTDSTGAKVARKKAITAALSGEPWRAFVVLWSGKLEYYLATEGNKRGYMVTTYDPHIQKKRPGIPQYILTD